MYDKDTDKFGMCKNSDLIEELGQIDFVFSDKTGTLTQNIMIFKKCTIKNTVIGEPQNHNDDQANSMAKSAKRMIVDTIFNGANRHLSSYLRDFFTMLAVCHTVMVE